MDQNGARIYYAGGTSDCWRWNLSGARPFEVNVFNYRGEMILRLQRPWKFSLFCWGGEWGGNV